MYRTLLGEKGFKEGMKLYFKRHDGGAVTCDDFRAAMAGTSSSSSSSSFLLLSSCYTLHNLSSFLHFFIYLPWRECIVLYSTPLYSTLLYLLHSSLLFSVLLTSVVLDCTFSLLESSVLHSIHCSVLFLSPPSLVSSCQSHAFIYSMLLLLISVQYHQKWKYCWILYHDRGLYA